MELNFSRFFGRVGIDIIDFDNFWDELNNFNNSIEFVNFHNVDQLLLEELIKSSIALISKFRIFVKVLLHLNREHMDEMFSPCILNRHLNNFVSSLHNVYDSVGN